MNEMSFCSARSHRHKLTPLNRDRHSSLAELKPISYAIRCFTFSIRIASRPPRPHMRVAPLAVSRCNLSQFFSDFLAVRERQNMPTAMNYDIGISITYWKCRVTISVYLKQWDAFNFRGRLPV